jgi:phospholipase/carboxylesterase
MPALSGPVVPPASGGPARQLVVLLHGWGANGDDLIGLAPAWARALPDARFVSPHAPDPCDQNPMGRQWFSFDQATPAGLARGAERARTLIEQFVEGEIARLKLPPERVALVGFSQGAMMALYIGLRRAPALGAVLGYSGALIGAEGLADSKARPPILLVHGDADPVVPVDSLHEALDALGQAGVAAQFHVARGLGHGIDEEGLALGAQFLRESLAAPVM